jgi:Leucine-rich repeat (LRR) protein
MKVSLFQYTNDRHSLFHLPLTESLLLNNNEFTGRLPSSMGRLTALQEMTIGFNYFTGSIPIEYKALSLLQHFHVKEIPLTGPFFEPFGAAWTKLQSLILDGTKLTGTIPSNVIASWADTMMDIQLGRSLFHGTFPTEIGTLTKLVNLNSVGDDLYGPFPNITTMTNLRTCHQF